MIKVYVDSGSSIKQTEKDKLNVEIMPLKIIFENKEYLDGINLSFEEFYHKLINEKKFPKTSLPNANDFIDEINTTTINGDDVIIFTISSKISGTYNYLRLTFNDNPKVHVIDSLSAVGGIRILVNEVNKYRNENIDIVLDKINNLIPKIKILAIPEVLTYLQRGGRLSKVGFIVGTIAQIKPIITFKEGAVSIHSKVRGLKHAMKELVRLLSETNCDPNYPIVPSYTYSDDNLKEVISMLPEAYQSSLTEFDNLDPAIAAHWGPNAFGFIFVTE